MQNFTTLSIKYTVLAAEGQFAFYNFYNQPRDTLWRTHCLLKCQTNETFGSTSCESINLFNFIASFIFGFGIYKNGRYKTVKITIYKKPNQVICISRKKQDTCNEIDKFAFAHTNVWK